VNEQLKVSTKRPGTKVEHVNNAAQQETCPEVLMSVKTPAQNPPILLGIVIQREKNNV